MVAPGNNGRARIRRPVRRKYALASAGASVGTPSSPTPPIVRRRSLLGELPTIVTATSGISPARIIRLALKLRAWTAPLTKVC
jgi:hypothetical protein